MFYFTCNRSLIQLNSLHDVPLWYCNSLARPRGTPAVDITAMTSSGDVMLSGYVTSSVTSPIDSACHFPSSKLEVVRERRPPPNANITELWQFFPDPDRDRNGLPDPDSNADRHQNVIISWSLSHTPALRKISSKTVGNSVIQ